MGSLPMESGKMPCNSYEENTYLDRLLREAIKRWDPVKPRRWLARYGSLHALGIGNGDCAQRYREIQAQAIALTRRGKRPESTGSLPNIIYPDW
ncbi:hypothetical protein [Aeromonas jandaei]|uniref:hypothetical protein n=1 Tax=Aeromonas jandaei TaxID=650 RepID=UPI0011170348|nr:hypothetical protein [Aeromonas jandaei]TNI04240.1 hypothetical protein CF104_08270 [Aeromonas jandaei]